MRYVTITKSQFLNNGTGIVPNAQDSEKFPPPEDNVITDNDVFWNNFDYYKGAPFKVGDSATGTVPYPIGVGILLFGGHGNTRRRTTASTATGWTASARSSSSLLKEPDAADLSGNSVTGNTLGAGGTDLNGHDLFYDGDGSGNCFGPNTGVNTMFPADGSTFAPCPFSGTNTFNKPPQDQAVSWALAPDHEAAWQRHPHAAKAGYTPLEIWTKSRGDK